MNRAYPFDSVVTGLNEFGLPQGDREYGSEELRRYIKSFLNTGIKNGGTNLKVIENGGLNLKVEEGIAIIEGAFFEIYNEPELLTVNSNSISRIIIRLDLRDEERNISVKVIEGLDGVVPELTRTSEIYDISLAQVISNETEITSITDERDNSEVCGYINSLITFDESDILAKIQTELDSIISRVGLITKFNKPDIEVINSINTLLIDLPLENYDEMQRVKLYIEPQEFEEFSSGIFPTSSQNGFIHNKTSGDSTNNYITMSCPMVIKPTNFYVEHVCDSTSGTRKVTFYGSNDGTNWETLINEDVTSIAMSNGYYSYSLNYDGEKSFTNFKVNMYNSKGASSGNVVRAFNITSGQKSLYNMSNTTNLKIGSLESKNVNALLKPRVMYELIYRNNIFESI